MCTTTVLRQSGQLGYATIPCSCIQCQQQAHHQIQSPYETKLDRIIELLQKLVDRK